MEINGEYQIAGSREDVWAALNDPEMLKKCIPGCESLEMVSETEFNARVVASIGPVKAKFDTLIRLENLQAPISYTLSGEGKAGAAGFGRGAANVNLQENDSGTLLVYDADFKVGGKLAQIGSRLVLGATRKTADDFFAAFSKELDPGASRISHAPAETPGQATGRWINYAVGASILLFLILWNLLR